MLSRLAVFFVLIISAPYVEAKKVKVNRKIQEVNFGEMDIKGTVRNPDGAFLVQKRGIKFLPLVKVQKNFDDRIRESIFYVK